MKSKTWVISFFVILVMIFLSLLLFNFVVNPFGAFQNEVLSWDSYNMTNNPRVAKISYLDKNFEEYDSYIIGSSSTSSFSTQKLNELYDANFYNLTVYGSDMMDFEVMASHVIENYNVENLVLSVYINSGIMYNMEGNDLNSMRHYKLSDQIDESSFYQTFLTLDPKYSMAKLKLYGEDTFLSQSFDVFNAYTGTYDKNARDIEPINGMDNYLEKYSEFIDYKNTPLTIHHTDNVVKSVSNIKSMCDEKGINFILVTAPVYYKYMDNFNTESIMNFYKKLVTVTDFWDFSISSVSYEPRYFYDSTHFRNNVGDMAIDRIAGNNENYITEDFGTYITSENVEEHFNTFLNYKEIESIEMDIPILMYHHFDDVGNNGTILNIENFENHIKTLKDNGFNSVSFQELIDYVKKGVELPENPFILTIDDGYSSNYELAYPILKKYDTKATIFIIGVSVGKDTYKDTTNPMYPHFTYEEAQEMINSGLISIQPHTYDMHQWEPFEEGVARPTIMKVPDETDEEYIKFLTEDFIKVKDGIESNTSEVVHTFSYPLGQSSELSEYILTSLGIESTVSTVPKISTVIKGLPQSLLQLGRFNITDSISSEDLLELLGFTS